MLALCPPPSVDWCFRACSGLQPLGLLCRRQPRDPGRLRPWPQSPLARASTCACLRAPPMDEVTTCTCLHIGDVAKGNKGSPSHINIVDRNGHSHSMRPQRIHRSHDDGDCDRHSANDADIDDDSDDGGKQQRKQVQQQHSSPAIKSTRFATTPMRARAPPFVPQSQHQPAARRVAQPQHIHNSDTERPSGRQSGN